MKRILVLLSVVALMVVMLVASVSPAFAEPPTFSANCINLTTGDRITLIDVKKKEIKKLEKEGYLCLGFIPET